MKKSRKNHETNHEKTIQESLKIIKKSMKIHQKSLTNEEKTCFPLQPEANFPKDDISENKEEKTKAQLLAVTGRYLYKPVRWSDLRPRHGFAASLRASALATKKTNRKSMKHRQ